MGRGPDTGNIPIQSIPRYEEIGLGTAQRGAKPIFTFVGCSAQVPRLLVKLGQGSKLLLA